MKKEEMYPIVEEWLTCKGKVNKVDFCSKHNITYHSLGYWQTKYNKENLENLPKILSHSDFLPVKVNNESSTSYIPSTANPKAEIEFPSGLILKIY